MRPQALATALRAAGFEMKSVAASGDCFYDCIDMQLSGQDRPEPLADAGAMRDTVASSITDEMYELMKVFAQAGVEGYEFLTHHRAPQSLEEFRAFARRRGKDTGAGQCLWADEHAISTVAGLAGIRLLIFDEQASSRGSRSGRVRDGGAATADSRFVCVGEASVTRVALLHRSRRQHYSPIFFDGCGVLEANELPAATRALWPTLGSSLSVESAAPEPPERKDERDAKRRRSCATS